MTIPTRSDLRAAFAATLEANWCAPHDRPDPSTAIRAAVDVVLPEPPNRGRADPITMRLRAQLLALADAIQGDDHD